MDLASLGIRVQTAEVKSGAEDLDQLTTAAGRAKGAVDKLGPAAAGAADSVKKLGAGTRTVGPALATQAQSFQAAGISARQYSAALRTVPAQITDIVTGLAGGQNPFLVAIQQGGQLRDQFGGFGNTLRGLASVLTPARIGIGAIALTVGATVKSVLDAQREVANFATVLATSGRNAGITTGELRGLNEQLRELPGGTADAADALTGLAGRVPTEKLSEFADAARQFSRASGDSIADVVKAFQQLERKPTEALAAIQEKFKFVNAEAFKNVSTLERAGDLSGAAAAAQSEFARGLREAGAEIEAQRGSLINLQRTLSEFSFRDFFRGVARVIGAPSEQTAEAELALRRQLRGNRELFSSTKALDKSNDLRERQLETIIEVQQREAASKRESTKATDAAVESEKKFSNTLKRSIADAEALSKARFGADISGLRRTLDARLDAFAGSEAELDALRSAGLVSDKEFFDRRRQLIEESTAAQVESLRQQAARLAEENASGVEAIMNQERRRDLQAEINRLLADGATRQKVLSIEQEGATRKLTASLDDAKRSAAEFLETLDRSFSRELELQGAGSKARQRQGEVDRIRDQFDSQRRQLDREQRRDPSRAEALDQERAVIDQSEIAALEKLEEKFAKLDELSGSFAVGAGRAFNEYLDGARDVAAQSEQLFTSAFRGAEDALVEFATTGKLSFKDLANSILQDLVRIQIRALIVRAIAGSGALSGLFGGGAAAAGGSIGARASGGPVDSGRPYLVGEQGPELFVPRSNGQIIPSKQTMQLMSSGQQRGGPVINIVNNNTFESGIDQTRIEPMLRASEARTRQAIADDLRRGRLDGALSGAQR